MAFVPSQIKAKKNIAINSACKLFLHIARFHKKCEWRELRQVRIAATDPRRGGKGEVQRGQTHGEGATV
jgi:hypothetical protein